MISKLNAVIGEAVGVIIIRTKCGKADPCNLHYTTPADIANPLVM